MTGSDEGTHLPTETGTSPGMRLGTAGYMSPEQASGQPVDFRSDQFAFGSILYEMVTGKRAFLKKTGVDTLAAVLNEEPEPIARLNPDAPAPLRWVAERCLAKDPDSRYDSTKDLARELRNLRDNLVDATKAQTAETSGRRGWLAMAGAVLTLGVLGAAYFAAQKKKKGRTRYPSGGESSLYEYTRSLSDLFVVEGMP